ncbi:hypothetical protein B0T25DRAFT_535983 [Lasiosphaeria hispida]|uniref:WSC domain-containing protein n=1 Tax=Lasiosphaeria hispida TaxID=260671 RepID=A0AAJ0HSX7_9PEZI|nr:hypothetical protein B0T25DRAFT_535983 [Lasiosphaeria hispida]
MDQPRMLHQLHLQPRGLSISAILSGGITVNVCQNACSNRDVFVGVYGAECWCGNSIGGSSITAAKETECNMKCAGN